MSDLNREPDDITERKGVVTSLRSWRWAACPLQLCRYIIDEGQRYVTLSVTSLLQNKCRLALALNRYRVYR